MNDYHARIWKAAVEEAERAVMRLTATATGGKTPLETVDAYVARVRKLQDEALAELAEARRQLNAATAKKA